MNTKELDALYNEFGMRRMYYVSKVEKGKEKYLMDAGDGTVYWASFFSGATTYLWRDEAQLARDKAGPKAKLRMGWQMAIPERIHRDRALLHHLIDLDYDD